MGNLPKNDEIKVNLNLMNMNGIIEKEPKESICHLSKQEKNKGDSQQVEYTCTVPNLEEDYYTFKLNYSESIAGIPYDDPILIDPMMTKSEIEKGELLDYSNPKNKKAPPTFTSEEIIEGDCQTSGKFIIKGKLSEEITEPIEFTLPLTYPDGISLKCSINENIECEVDRKIDSDNIIIEQTIVKDGMTEIMNLMSVSSKSKINCADGLLKEAKEKDSKIAFRQVSNLEIIDDTKFSFVFVSLISGRMEENAEIDLNMVMDIGNVEKEKTATCKLDESV